VPREGENDDSLKFADRVALGGRQCRAERRICGLSFAPVQPDLPCTSQFPPLQQNFINTTSQFISPAVRSNTLSSTNSIPIRSNAGNPSNSFGGNAVRSVNTGKGFNGAIGGPSRNLNFSSGSSGVDQKLGSQKTQSLTNDASVEQNAAQNALKHRDGLGGCRKC
jgi:hypothetical protein